MSKPTLPLGRGSDYPSEYDPGVLFPISRNDSRAQFNLASLPFHGVDIWNAWELTWLDSSGLPRIATAEIRVPANSPNLIESKSLKLYLNSFAMSRYEDQTTVRDVIRADLSRCAAGDVAVTLFGHEDAIVAALQPLPGDCLDELAVRCDVFDVDPGQLQSDISSVVEETLHTHLLRSLCPVTAQPDIGSLAVHYKGPRIDREGLLRYIVSYREHNDFHEACIERMFFDIQQRCGAQSLSIYARYQRRGGLDINPFRSNFEDDAPNLRLWRQ